MRVNKVQVVYCYEKICDVCLYCGMLGHEHHACDAKFNDDVRKMTRANEYDAWMLVHGEKRSFSRRREYRRETQNSRDDWRGGEWSKNGVSVVPNRRRDDRRKYTLNEGEKMRGTHGNGSREKDDCLSKGEDGYREMRKRGRNSGHFFQPNLTKEVEKEANIATESGGSRDVDD
ncbi:hypothetical protein LIER_29627 [Lithospermum erythrorhizon]|uniref:CCHC-type domain-containing protein n=1 Tax=Lithospermum erythrorhizon TaxID=34254 RepID=A0AAV3RJS8_LITER